MARSPAKKASKPKAKKSAKKMAPKAAKAVRKSAKKSAGRNARPRKAPKAAPKRARKSANKLQSPAHLAKMADIRRRVARHHPGEAPMIRHEQQDPSIIPPPQPPQAPVDHLHGNYGDSKARSVARQDNPTNWFRQAPKAKSK